MMFGLDMHLIFDNRKFARFIFSRLTIYAILVVVITIQHQLIATFGLTESFFFAANETK